MKQTLEGVVRGNPDILRFYARAIEHWRQILQKVTPLDVPELAKYLTYDQLWFEQNCGGQYLGEEIMAVSGIAQFYSSQDGFVEKEKATSVAKALIQSGCSIEVKGWAEEVAKFYALI